MTKKEQSKVKKETEYIASDGTVLTEDEWNSEAIIDGPTRGEIEEFKKKYGAVYYYAHDSGPYIFRSFTRSEYKDFRQKTEELLGDAESEDGQVRLSEELMTNLCVLYPENYAEISGDEIPAGVPTTLANMIYEKSGFSQVSVPIKL